MEKSLFFNDLGEGYLYQAEDFASYFNSFIGNGIYAKKSDNLQVVADNGFDIKIKSGKAWINGYLYVNTKDITVTINQSDGALSRIDAIAVRWGDNKLQVVKIEGEYSNTPEAPMPTRDENTYDLILAYIHVNAGIIEITQAEIEDTRLNKELCGLMHGLIEQVDTTTLYNQIKSDLSSFKDIEQRQFIEWFENIKGLLDEDIGTTLALKVNTLEEQTRQHYAQQVDSVEGVHGFRYNSENETLEIKSSGGEWTEVSGGSAGAILSPVKKIKIKTLNGKLKISWIDPDDITWAGTKLVYKIGTSPQNPKDGTLVVDNKEKNKYSNEGIEVNALTNGTKYYFMFFPYDNRNKYSFNLENSATGTPHNYRMMTLKIDQNNSNPETCCTYHDDAIEMIPGSEEWDEFFGHFPCMFKTGQVVGKLKKDDRTKYEDGRTADITSGAEGDVMIAFPKRQIKINTDNNIVTICMTDDPEEKEGFVTYAHQRGEEKKDFFYMGAYKGSIIGNQLRSLSGKSILRNQSMNSFRTYARNNGLNYEINLFYQWQYILIMYVLKYKNLNAQEVLGYFLNDYNASDFPIQTGGTEKIPMDGEKKERHNNHFILFGIEDFIGNMYEFADGIHITSDGKILTSTNNFTESGNGYKLITNRSQMGSVYFSSIYGNNELQMLGNYGGGSSSIYYCSHGYFTSFKSAMRLGLIDKWNVNTGLFTFHLGENPDGNHKENFSTRLVYL